MPILTGAFVRASESGHLQVVEYLFSLGTYTLKMLNDALYHAVDHDRLSVVRFLVEHGATDVISALAGASGKGFLDIVKYLIESGSGIPYLQNSLRNAVINEKFPVVQYLSSEALRRHIPVDFGHILMFAVEQPETYAYLDRIITENP